MKQHISISRTCWIELMMFNKGLTRLWVMRAKPPELVARSIRTKVTIAKLY